MVYRYNQCISTYSKAYIIYPEIQPFRDVFMTYELLAYLSVKASRLELKT